MDIGVVQVNLVSSVVTVTRERFGGYNIGKLGVIAPDAKDNICLNKLSLKNTY